MATNEQKIKCPKCHESISIDEVLAQQIGEKIRKEIERRKKVEKSLRRFLLQIDPEKEIKEQILDWIKKEGLDLSEADIEGLVDKAYSKYEELQSDKNRKKFFEKS